MIEPVPVMTLVRVATLPTPKVLSVLSLMVSAVPLRVRVCAIVPVTAVQLLVSVPIDCAALFRMTVVALVLVWKKVRLPVPSAEPLLIVIVPLPIWVEPVFVFAVPARIRLPAAALTRLPAPIRLPERVSTAPADVGSMRFVVPSASTTLLRSVTAAPLSVLRTGLAD